MKDINEKNNLDYITEVSPEELTGLFFMDYTDTVDVRRVRNGWMDARDLAIHTATLDWSKVKRFRVQSYEDLVQPVNEDGFTECQCESRDIDFVPVLQKIEYFFGSLYRIDREKFERSKDKDYGLYEGLYVGTATGLIVVDVGSTICDLSGSEDSFKNPETSYVLLDMSMSKDALDHVRKILDDNGLDLARGHALLQKLLEEALEDLNLDDEPDSNNAIQYIKELDESEKNSRQKSIS